MSYEALDSPKLLLPRVGDVHGTLLRLGFTGATRSKDQFYTQFVKLFEGGVKAPHAGRNISHISITITILAEDKLLGHGPHEGRVWIHYGYPTLLRRKKKIISRFKQLISAETFSRLSLVPDQALRESEKTLAYLIESAKTKRVPLTQEFDSAEGIIEREILPWEALVKVVQGTISSRSEFATEWWIDEACASKSKPNLIRLNSQRIKGRLPNFDRRRALRSFRRPV